MDGYGSVMAKLLLAALAFIAALLAADRLFLWMEARGWLYYRRKKPNLSGSVYHILELQSVFDPGAEQVQEIIVEDEQQEDESGDPPVPKDEADGPPASLSGSPDRG
jgi:hypothetical protein